jgi:Family of unknown function (DUF6171)
MDWPEALDIIVGETRHERYRDLCSGEHPDHKYWRRRMVETATGADPKPTPLPTLLEMAGNAAGAAKRLAFAWMSGNEVTVSLEEMEARLTICMECEHFDHGSVRCRKCGCWLRKKAALKTEHCPLDPPKW